ncbi:hypothetical protein [uncultured Campylobacter sp.]|uniref:hypothetical protein n=1 Tax=uncultured Campylobacter sp. TaxID=218934 RepID=UPI0025EAF3D2|nr:hypothetical protein [uncultured Campylobacter sp.]
MRNLGVKSLRKVNFTFALLWLNLDGFAQSLNLQALNLKKRNLSAKSRIKPENTRTAQAVNLFLR